MFKEYNKTVFRHLSQIFGTNSLLVHAKCVVKTIDGSLAYKRILSHLFGKNSLNNRDVACNTTISISEYHGDKQSFNWENYTNLNVEQHSIKSILTAHE